jgi:hypothetical protein
VGGSFRGGYGGGSFRGGYGGYGFRGGFNRFGGSRYYFGFGFGYPYWGYPYWGYPYGYGYSGYYDPYYYPSSYYDGSGYGSSYDYGYNSAPAYQSSPPVVIEQNYSTPPPQQQGQQGGPFYRQADYYLIAFNDHTIQAAVSFHVDGDQLIWTTREHVERRAPLSSVDRRFSEQINRDRRVEFRLP